MSGTLQSIVVFSQYVRFNLAVIPTFNLTKISSQPS